MSDWERYESRTGAMGSTYQSDFDQGSQSGMTDRARAGVDQVRHGAREMSGKARQGFDHYFHRHPLLIGAGVMALGVAVGMLFPTTKQEDRWMGEASQRVKERTREAASRVGEVARHSLEEARDTAQSEMHDRGLDPQSLKEDARDAAKQAKEVAQKSAEEAKRTAKEEAEKKG